MKEIRKDVGQTLKSRREEKGLTLERASKETRITQKYLRALEEDKYNLIPGDVVLKGFIKVYSEYLGLDGQALLGELSKKMKKYSKEIVEQCEPDKPWIDMGSVKKIAATLLIGVVVLALAFAVFRGIGRLVGSIMSAQKAPKPAAVKPLPAKETPAPEKQEAAPPATPEKPRDVQDISLPAATEGGVSITVETNDKSWMLVTVDGSTVFSGTMPAGVSRAFNASERIFVKIGNSAAVRILSAGQEVFSPGEYGRTASRVFTR